MNLILHIGIFKMIKYISLKEFKKNPNKFSEQDVVWICSRQKLSESFMRKMKDHLIWSVICTFQNLREEFIIEMKDYVDWNMVSANQDISEKFMDEYSEYLNWEEISSKQDFSEKFAWRHIEEIDIFSLFHNTYQPKLSETFYRTLFHYKWDEQKGNCKFLIYPTYCSPKFSKDFVREFKHMFNCEIMNFLKSKNKKEAQKFFEEMRGRIGNDKTEWNFFIIDNNPSIVFLQRWKEEYIPQITIRKEKYSKKDQKIIDDIVEEFKHNNDK